MVNSDRKRHWIFIYYPLPPDYILPDIFLASLRALGLDFAISPLHDPDSVADPLEVTYYNLETNKKPHYHIVVGYDGKKSQQNVIDDLSILGDRISKPFPCKSISGTLRYFVHWGYPDKQQFGESIDQARDSIYAFGNFIDTLDKAFELGDFDQYKIISQINQFILDNGITEFLDLYEYSIVHEPKWAYVLDKFPCRSVHGLLSSSRHYRK